MQHLFTPQAIIAHRGDSAHAPENTLRAFRQAMDKHADGIELDVHLSADGEVVVIHDAYLNRTTNGHGLVAEHTLAELRKLDAGEGETIPTLSEVLDILDENTFLNIELKGIHKKISTAVPRLVIESGKQAQIIYSSFAPTLLYRLRQNLPDAKLGLLTLPGFSGKFMQMVYEPALQPWSLNPHHSTINPQYLEKAKQRGRRVFTYTVNQPEDVKRILQMGVDGIFTDDPEASLALRSEIK